jgi:hypothetical protein
MSEQGKVDAAREAWRSEWRRMRERNAQTPQSPRQPGTMTLVGVNHTVVVQMAGLHPEHQAALIRKALARMRGKGECDGW